MKTKLKPKKTPAAGVIHDYLIKSGLSTGDLAKRWGVSRQSVWLWMTGRQAPGAGQILSWQGSSESSEQELGHRVYLATRREA